MLEDYDELFEDIKLNKSGYLKTIDKVFTQYQIPLELKISCDHRIKTQNKCKSLVLAQLVFGNLCQAQQKH